VLKQNGKPFFRYKKPTETVTRVVKIMAGNLFSVTKTPPKSLLELRKSWRETFFRYKKPTKTVAFW
jgi:hypothetical protein